MFYRLLFDKYANYTKKNFSVFILTNQSKKANQDELSDDEDATVEFQLSLKFDPKLCPYVLNNKVNLIYCVKSRDLFENVISLLHGLIKEIIPDRMYSTYDPDGNQVYLIDSSSLNSNLFVNYLNTACFSNYLNKNTDNLQISSISSLSSNLSNSHQKLLLANHSPLGSCFNNLSPNSNSNSSSVHTPTNSTTSTNNIPNAGSLDSYKDSGRCSTISFSNEFINSNTKGGSNSFTSTEISNSSSLIKNAKAQSLSSESGTGVKDLIKKFNIEQLKFNQTKNQIKNKQVDFAAIQNNNVKKHYPSSLVDYYSFDNLTDMTKKINCINNTQQRPASSLGQPLVRPFHEFNRIEINNRPKSCTQFNLFPDVQSKNYNKKYPNCFQMNNKHQVNDNYSTNSSSGKY